MNILVLKTNIDSQDKILKLGLILKNKPDIKAWNIDLDDCDKVLRIEASDNLSDQDIIKVVKPIGLYCSELPD